MLIEIEVLKIGVFWKESEIAGWGYVINGAAISSLFYQIKKYWMWEWQITVESANKNCCFQKSLWVGALRKRVNTLNMKSFK